MVISIFRLEWKSLTFFFHFSKDIVLTTRNRLRVHDCSDFSVIQAFQMMMGKIVMLIIKIMMTMVVIMIIIKLVDDDHYDRHLLIVIIFFFAFELMILAAVNGSENERSMTLR